MQATLRTALLLISAAGLLLLGGEPGPAPVRAADGVRPGDGGVTVSLRSLTIQRRREYTANGKPAATQTGMTAELLVQTPSTAQPIEYFEVKLDRAQDDAGHELVQARSAGFFGTQRSLLGPRERADHAFTAELPAMACPADGARRLGTLSGSLKVRLAGDIRQVRIAGAIGRRGQTLKPSQLSGVELTIARDTAPNVLTVTAAGKVDALVNVQVANAAGQIVNLESTAYGRQGNTLTWTLTASAPLAADTQLLLDTADRTWEVQAPFAFHAIELP
ncbi:MAG: hypothetical protein BIFFINMI_02680 [Phycisphaerae bacterium]|nr:hypothetical protein [Phycisphaerae bacterium]